MPYLFRIIMQTQLVPQQFSNYTIDDIELHVPVYVMLQIWFFV